MIRVALRLDDPSETSHQAVEAGILDVLRRHRASATFAVIPFRMVDGQRVALTADRAHPLIAAANDGVIEIALHGHVHVRQRPAPAPPTEFSGRPEAEQRALIEEGRAHLRHIFQRDIDGFVPPWNSYDLATLNSLEALQFHYLSAGWEQPARYRGGIRLLPRTAHLSDVPAAVQEARRFSRAEPTIVVVMHHFDFAESGSDRAIFDMHGFDAVLQHLTSEADLQICTLGALASLTNAPNGRLLGQRRLMTHALGRRLLPRNSFLNKPLWQGMIAGALRA